MQRNAEAVVRDSSERRLVAVYEKPSSNAFQAQMQKSDVYSFIPFTSGIRGVYLFKI
jgi:hypothetical protein